MTPYRLLLPVVSTRVEERWAFLLSTLAALEVQLNQRPYPVTWEHRPETIGATILGTARIVKNTLLVEADVSIPWMLGDALIQAIIGVRGIGVGLRCSVTAMANVRNIRVVEAVDLHSVSLTPRVADDRRVEVVTS